MQKLTQKPIRGSVLKVLVSNNITVKMFRNFSSRTRLNNENNLIKIEQHINLWKKYQWI